MKAIQYLLLVFCLATYSAFTQPIPSPEENIPFLVTFGRDAGLDCGDPDREQDHYLLIPRHLNVPFYVRIYDPDCGGAHDEISGIADTRTRFSVWGAPVDHPLDAQEFTLDEEFDGQWYTLGPFRKEQAEYLRPCEAYIFRLRAEGVNGDDGNYYRYFISWNEEENKAIDGNFALADEVTFCPSAGAGIISHFRPFLCSWVDALEIDVTAKDFRGSLRLVTSSRPDTLLALPAGDSLLTHRIPIPELDRGSAPDLQVIPGRSKGRDRPVLTIRFRDPKSYLLVRCWFTCPARE